MSGIAVALVTCPGRKCCNTLAWPLSSGVFTEGFTCHAAPCCAAATQWCAEAVVGRGGVIRGEGGGGGGRQLDSCDVAGLSELRCLLSQRVWRVGGRSLPRGL